VGVEELGEQLLRRLLVGEMAGERDGLLVRQAEGAALLAGGEVFFGVVTEAQGKLGGGPGGQVAPGLPARPPGAALHPPGGVCEWRLPARKEGEGSVTNRRRDCQGQPPKSRPIRGRSSLAVPSCGPPDSGARTITKPHKHRRQPAGGLPSGCCLSHFASCFVLPKEISRRWCQRRVRTG